MNQYLTSQRFDRNKARKDLVAFKSMIDSPEVFVNGYFYLQMPANANLYARFNEDPGAIGNFAIVELVSISPIIVRRYTNRQIIHNEYMDLGFHSKGVFVVPVVQIFGGYIASGSTCCVRDGMGNYLPIAVAP